MGEARGFQWNKVKPRWILHCSFIFYMGISPSSLCLPVDPTQEPNLVLNCCGILRMEQNPTCACQSIVVQPVPRIALAGVVPRDVDTNVLTAIHRTGTAFVDV